MKTHRRLAVNKLLTLKVDPDLIKFFSSTLSKAGSSSSPTSSMMRGRPRDRLSSRWARKYLWLRAVTYRDEQVSTGTGIFVHSLLFFSITLIIPIYVYVV